MFQEEQNLSSLQSSMVNKAYSTILNPLSRGIYLVRARADFCKHFTDDAFILSSEIQVNLTQIVTHSCLQLEVLQIFLICTDKATGILFVLTVKTSRHIN
jgi:hypothetical protein